MENLGYSKFIVGLATFFPIPLPLPRAATDFKACFKTYLHKADTAALIDELSALKLNVVQLCLDNNVSFEAKLPVVDAYLAALWRLQDSLLATGGIVKADRELAFDWRLYVSGHAEAFRSNEVLFEIIMIMHTKALFHFHVAKNLLESDSVAFLSEAGKHMLSAASAMDYLQQQISSTKWLRKFNYAAQNPPETSASVCQGLAGFFKMCAASLAVVKAVSSSSVFSAAEPSAPAKGPSALVKARLCMAVVNHARSSVDFLSNSNTTGGKLSLWINERLMHHIAATRELYSSVTKYYLAQSNYEKSEVGLCIGFCQNAKVSQAVLNLWHNLFDLWWLFASYIWYNSEALM